jgi:hypothetical protein
MVQASVDIPLRCRCGHVRGVAKEVAPGEGFRFICYCGDCRAFARFLERPDVLDQAGGTDIFQMPLGRVKLTAGLDAVRCLKLSDRVYRWYTECCRTPIGNSAGARFPIIGLIHSFTNHDGDGHGRDDVLGAPLCSIFASSAIAPLPPDAPPPPSASLYLTRLPKLLSWWVRGLGRPNPFFDAETSAPISAPRVLMPSEPIRSQ